MALVCNKGICKGFDSKGVMICNDLNRKVLRGFSCRLENDVSKVLFKNPIFGNHRVNRVFITSCRDY